MLEWLQTFLQRALIAPLWPLHEFLSDGHSRYFWLYCVTGILLGAYVHFRRKSDKTYGELMLDADVWASRSAWNDYIVLILGSVIRLTVLSWAFINWKPIAAFVVKTLAWLGVSGTVTDGQAIAAGVALTVALFLVDDFLKFYAHFLMHKIPEFWEFHKVHHSAEHLNFATAERLHPMEVVFTSFTVAIGLGLVNGLFIAFFGDKLTPVTVFGANVLLFATNIVGGVMRHSPMWISFGPRIERWLISPAMHQIHHSGETRHFDKNMGAALSCWDRWFGTIYIPQGGPEIKEYGIGEETRDFRSLKVIYLRPFTESWRLLKARIARALTPAGKVEPAE